MQNANFLEEVSKQNSFSLSKTLCFELKPMVFNESGALTPIAEKDSYLKNLNEYFHEIIEEDKQRASDYENIKPYIDILHKQFINKALSVIEEDVDFDLEKARELYELTKKRYDKAESGTEKEKEQKSEKEEHKKNWEDFQKELRKRIAIAFNKGDLEQEYKDLVKENKNLFNKTIPQTNFEQITEKTPKELAESFYGFTTYFTGFNQNRENIYLAEGSTGIAHRLVNENLPKFINNIINFEKIQKNHPDLFKEFEQEQGTEILSQCFYLKNFVHFLSQSGIDRYNELIEARKNQETSESKKGLRQIINEYKQKTGHRDINLNPLFNQILGKHGEKNEQFIKEIKEDRELINSLEGFHRKTNKLAHEIIQLLKNLKGKNKEQLFISGSERENLSQILFGDFSLLNKILKHYFIESQIDDKRKKETSLEKKSEDELRKREYYSLAEIDLAIEFYLKMGYELKFSSHSSLLDYFSDLVSSAGKTFSESIEEAWRGVSEHILNLKNLDKDRSIPTDKNPSGGVGFQQITKIKNFLDAYMELLHFAKPLHLTKKKELIEVTGADEDFYSHFNKSYRELKNELLAIYNKSRNYLTKKPFSKEKIKVNFQNGTLLRGWDVNKEDSNLGVLFIKDDNYYLGIMRNNKIFDFNHKTKGVSTYSKAVTLNPSENIYKKVMYKYLANPSQMLPKVFFVDSDCRIKKKAERAKQKNQGEEEAKDIKSSTKKSIFEITDELNRIINTSSFTKNGKAQKGYKKAEFNLGDCHKMIDFYKNSIKVHKDWSNFNFNFLETSMYQDISEFYADIDRGGYKISFENIREDYIGQCIKDGELVLFQIYNKDFSKFKKNTGTPNLHTIYFKEVFQSWLDGRECNIKLNGEAEIFFRKASIERKITHPAHKAIEVKNQRNINEEYEKFKTFDYDLIKDRRFTVDKFFFHVPISLNYQSKKAKSNKAFNESVNASIIKHKPDINIIGIDRGERNLLYYTIIDQNGKIIEQNSFNHIYSEYQTDKGLKEHKFDYHYALDKKEGERDKARKSWGTIENIKELKSGYLSHVVHQLALLILKHNAIVCLEDLNSGFKRSRLKIEKQVYQNFELALAKKLANLILKRDYQNNKLFTKLDFNDRGSVVKPYQLCYEVANYQDIYSQTGIIFFVEPSYTSKICPRTGFINFLDLRYQNLSKAKELINDLNKISFNTLADYFEFDLDFKKINQTKAKECGEQTRWIVCTYGDTRYDYDPSATEKVKEVNVTSELKTLFEQNQINYQNGLDLKEQILGKDSVNFYKQLLHLLKLTMTLRHSRRPKNETKEVKDFILSPIKDPELGFFDSQLLENISGSEAKEPRDADANGAYHIAMKGLLILQERLSSPNPKLTIRKEDWFNFIQNHHEAKWKEKSPSHI